MNLKTRLAQLEQQAQPTDTPWSILRQGMEDPQLFHDQAGREYRRGAADWPAKVILIVYGDGAQPVGRG